MKDDTISRQAAIDALRMDIDIIPYAKAREYARAVIETVYNRLEQLQPAQPEKADTPTGIIDRPTNAPTDCISRQAAIDDIRTMNPKDAKLDIKWVEMWLKQLPSVQPEPIWGLHASVGRPLGDQEIVPRLRQIQKQIGGSYAIDRAVEVIEAIAERRTDDCQ